MNFLAELIVRLFGKTPAFFKTLQYIQIAIAIITGLPTLLIEAGVNIPESLDSIVLQVISVSSLVGTFIAQLTLTNKEKESENIKD